MTDIRQDFDWLFHTDAGLLARAGIGAAIFAALALIDIYRRRAQATRWREYLFLLTVVAMAFLYGVVNDLLTCRISWEYFLYGKGLVGVLGDAIPPDPALLSWEAAKIGLKATWSAGLIIGVAMLVANNPSARRRQLPYRQMLIRAAMILLGSALCAAILGVAGYRGCFVKLSTDFAEMTRNNEFRPPRFMAVYGIHLGGYVGAAIGIIVAIVSIRLSRKAT